MIPQRHGVFFDALQDIHDAAVLKEHLIVNEAPELLGELPHRAKRMLPGVLPIVVDPTHSGIRAHACDGRQGHHAGEVVGEFLAAIAGHQEIPERLEAAPLVGIGDGVATLHDVVQQFVLGPSPERDAFAHLTIQGPEILLDLTEVGQQVARHLHELLEAVPNLGLVQHRQFPGLDPFDLGFDFRLAPMQVGDALFGIGLGTRLDLFQKVYQCQQA